MRKKRRYDLLSQDDGDPLSVVVNLFDVAMVFAVALMVAMVMHMNMTEDQMRTCNKEVYYG